MAKILYGVCGEGMGHALRTTAVLEFLQKKHEIVVLSSSRAYKHLSSTFDRVYEIHGFHLEYKNNEVDNFGSFIGNTAKLPAGLMKSVKMINDLVKEFDPEICITDFEPFTCNTAMLQKLPCIAIDNNNVVVKGKIEFDKKFLSDYLMAQAVSNYTIPDADYFLITTFFFPESKGDNTIFFPPIIRKKIQEIKKELPKAKPKHVMVYQTSQSNSYLLDLLKNVNEKFIIYGFEKDEKDENLHFKSFGHEDYYKDFLNAKGVITNGGFSLISEALYLQKPVLSEPVKKQFEQILNATYIEKIGLGMFTERISFGDIIRFLSRLPEFKKNLMKLKFDDNKRLFTTLEKLITTLTTKEKKQIEAHGQ